ncbi:MAG: hypothetical protein WA854_13480 [Candidatus Binataceae bacterium]
MIRFGDAALVLIEVKLTDTRNSDLGALPGYRKWLDAQPFGFRRALLLVTDRNADGEHDGFHIVTWKELCLNLRRLLPDLVKRAETITAVLSAAFVGAVEINLLGFPPLRWNGGKSEDEMVGRVSLLGSRIDELIQHLSSARF